MIFRGDPKQYCNYAFKVLDKNQSGTLSFDEYMTALSLTVPGDIEHQLTLVCIQHFSVVNADILDSFDRRFKCVHHQVKNMLAAKSCFRF